MDGAEARTNTTRRAERAGLVCLLGVAAFLRFFHLDARELWFDENCTYYIVHHLPDWPSDGPPFFQEVGHIPYFGLLNAWTRLATESIFGLRSLSAIAGILTVLAVAQLATRLGGRTVGWIAGALTAVHPVHIHYSQEARSYALWLLFITLALHALCLAASESRRRWWLLYGVLAYVAFLTHYYALLWFPATAATVLLATDRRRFWRSWFAAHVVLIAACVPVIAFLVIPLSHHGARSWFHEMWNSYPPSMVIPKSLWMMLPTGGYSEVVPRLAAATSTFSQPWIAVLDPLLRWGPVSLVVGLAIAVWIRVPPSDVGEVEGSRPPPLPSRERGRGEGSAGGASDGHQPSARRLSFMFFAISLGFLVSAFLNSVILEPTYIVGRYDQAAFPSVVLALAFLIDAAARTCTRRSATRLWLQGACTAAFCLCSGVVLLGVDRMPIKNRHRALAKGIAAIVGPDDLVVSVNKYVLYVLREFEEMHFAAEIISFPPEHDQQLCWLDSEAELADPRRIQRGVDATLARIKTAMASGRRVWALAHGEPTGPRWEVDRRLFAAIRATGIDVRPTGDENLGLAELLPVR